MSKNRLKFYKNELIIKMKIVLDKLNFVIKKKGTISTKIPCLIFTAPINLSKTISFKGWSYIIDYE